MRELLLGLFFSTAVYAQPISIEIDPAFPADYHPTQDIPNIQVTWVIMDPAAILIFCGAGTLACATYGVTEVDGELVSQCIIVTPPIRNSHDLGVMAVIGHELAHCRYGAYHE